MNSHFLIFFIKDITFPRRRWNLFPSVKAHAEFDEKSFKICKTSHTIDVQQIPTLAIEIIKNILTLHVITKTVRVQSFNSLVYFPYKEGIMIVPQRRILFSRRSPIHS